MTIEDIKQELRDIIGLSDKATPGPWSIYDNGGVHPCPGIESGRNSIVVIGDENDDAGVRTGVQDAEFITASRNLTPKMARALRTAIEALEAECPHGCPPHCPHERAMASQLETIRREWEVQV